MKFRLNLFPYFFIHKKKLKLIQTCVLLCVLFYILNVAILLICFYFITISEIFKLLTNMAIILFVVKLFFFQKYIGNITRKLPTVFNANAYRYWKYLLRFIFMAVKKLIKNIYSPSAAMQW